MAQGLSAPAPEALTVSEVERIVAQAVTESQALGTSSTVAVVDRVGNVLAVFAMRQSSVAVRIRPGPAARQDPLPPQTFNGFTLPPGFEDGNIGLQGLLVPRALAAISKAITGAYLSSAGNAFSTRTASMIVQPHFPPARFTFGLESGPLFGVQFSQLPCSDLSQRGAALGGGPRRAPLGLAADPGGLPLYKNGVVVGGIGVMADTDYGFDPDIGDRDFSVDEVIAVAGSRGFEAPQAIRANRISLDGTLLRFVDSEETRTGAPAPFAALNGSVGDLLVIPGYTDAAAVRPGIAYGTAASGLRPAQAGEFADGRAFLLVDAAGKNRYPPRGGQDAVPQPLSAEEVRVLLESAFATLARTRAQIRKPLNSTAQVTVSVVDSDGRVLGIVRAPDAPIFGTDVSLQKARSVAFLSNDTTVPFLRAAIRAPGLVGEGLPDPILDQFGARLADFVGPPIDSFAFAMRGLGNLTRPHYPDGEVRAGPGPLSPPIATWSPFATGVQERLINDNILQHVFFTLGLADDTPVGCTYLPSVGLDEARQTPLANGMQIFSGGVPIYRGGVLVGGIGVSGDGTDQDDLIAYFGLAEAGRRLGGAIGNAPPEIRSDRLVLPQDRPVARLRYVNCPYKPFLDTGAQNVCRGL